MKKLIALSTLAAALIAAPVSAHHSMAMFDHTKIVVVKGSLKNFSYQAPHAWISIMIPGERGAAAKQFDVETVSPGTLTGIGIQKETIKPGDKIEMGVFPLRDGRPAGMLLYLIGPDGKEYGWRTAEMRAAAAAGKPQIPIRQNPR